MINKQKTMKQINNGKKKKIVTEMYSIWENNQPITIIFSFFIFAFNVIFCMFSTATLYFNAINVSCSLVI